MVICFNVVKVLLNVLASIYDYLKCKFHVFIFLIAIYYIYNILHLNVILNNTFTSTFNGIIMLVVSVKTGQRQGIQVQ